MPQLPGIPWETFSTSLLTLTLHSFHNPQGYYSTSNPALQESIIGNSSPLASLRHSCEKNYLQIQVLLLLWDFSKRSYSCSTTSASGQHGVFYGFHTWALGAHDAAHLNMPLRYRLL